MKYLFILLLILTSCSHTELIDCYKQSLVYTEEARSLERDIIIINEANNTILYLDNIILNYEDTCNIKYIKSDTIKFKGKITSNNIVLYNDTIYVPYKETIKMYNGCPWYDKFNNRILQIIEFNISVNNWEDYTNSNLN